MSDPARFEQELAEGVDLFNRGHYFEAHDVWEDLWAGTRGPERPFLQGLIHWTVACYHMNNRNWRGARSQLEKARNRLGPFAPAHRGLDLTSVLCDVAEFRDRISGDGEPRLEGIATPSIRPTVSGPREGVE